MGIRIAMWLERQADGGYALVDVGSTNGTTINTVRQGRAARTGAAGHDGTGYTSATDDDSFVI